MGEKNLEELKNLQAKIIEKFPLVDCQLDKNHGVFLKATTKSSVTSGLRYLPNFHVIFTYLDSDSFCSTLITYHGRSLDTFVFKNYESESKSDLPEKVLAVLNNVTDGIKLCQGIDLSRLSDSVDCLIECFNDTIVARHKKCTFLLPSKTEAMECSKCQKLFSIKREANYELENNGRKIDPTSLVRTVLIKEEANYSGNDYNSLVEPVINYAKYDHENIDYHEDYNMITKENKKKRGRPVKVQDKLSLKSLSTRKRGRPRLVIPPNEIRPQPAKTVKKPKVDLEKDGMGGIAALKCKVCLKGYKTESAINIHFKSHEEHFDIEGILDCPECKKTIPKLDLTEHFDLVHSTKEQPKTCCIACLEIMPHINGDSLRLHIYNNHHQQNVCEICGKSFQYSRNLECHVKTQHSDVKEVFCDRCGKGFGHEYALQKHVQVVCAMEEWKCSICAKLFNNRKGLRFHLMVHCEDKPYSCKFCGYK